MKRQKGKSKRGAVMVFVLIAIVTLLGMAALGIDIAMIYAARRRAQNVADASVLAAGPLLPSTTTATAAAEKVAAANNADGPAFVITGITFSTASQAMVTLDDGTTMSVRPNHAITVAGYIDAPMSFASVVGYRPTSRGGRANTLSVSASATLLTDNVCSLPTGIGLAPFGVVADDPDSSDPTVVYMSRLLTTAHNSETPLPNTYQPLSKQITLKVSDWQQGSLNAGGNFGALAIGGSGGNTYKNAISSPTTVRFMVGQTIGTEPGNMVGPTRQGINNRLSASNTAFTHNYGDYINWFFGDQTQPIDTSMPAVTDGSNTYYYRQDPHRQELTDAHVVIIPLISQPPKNGRTETVILAFASFFIDATETTDNRIVTGRFIGVMIPDSSGGGCTGGGSVQWPRIVR